MIQNLDLTDLSAPKASKDLLVGSSFKSPPIPPVTVELTVRNNGDEIVVSTGQRELHMTVASALKLNTELVSAINAWKDSNGSR
jgi:hypothetical protein